MCPSRMSKESIMNHGGYGEVLEIINGIPVVIPESFMFKDGSLKRYGVELIKRLRAGKIGVQEFYAKSK